MVMRWLSWCAYMAAAVVCAAAVPDNYYYVTVIAGNGSTAAGVVANSSFGDYAFSVHHLGQGGPPVHLHPGDECEWEGLKGACVAEHRCLTTLDRDAPRHQPCPSTGTDAERRICCTDCQLVNDTGNVVFEPDSGLDLFWKTGQKSWDQCLRNLERLPTKCHPHRRGKIRRWRDEARHCLQYNTSMEGSLSPAGGGHDYPHAVMLGHDNNFVFLSSSCFGSLISERFVLSATHCATLTSNAQHMRFPTHAMLGASMFLRRHLQVKRIVRFYRHPDYVTSYGSSDIGLYETDSPVSFNEFVTPACLWSGPEEAGSEPPLLLLAAWRDRSSQLSLTEVRRHEAAACEAQVPPDRYEGERFGFDRQRHLCYGDEITMETCLGGGEGLVTRQVSSCLYSVVGVRRVIGDCRDGRGLSVYTRVAPFVPWIESIVWPN